VSVDGSTLLVLGSGAGISAIQEYGVADGMRLRGIGVRGDGPLQFDRPRQVCVAADGFVFVADYGNHRVQVLTPALDFHGLLGDATLDYPAGVCANADVVVVSEFMHHRISVFDRSGGALLRRFGSYGKGTAGVQLNYPDGLCFVSGDRHVAVADSMNNRVVVFSVDGDVIHALGIGVLYLPKSVVCSAFGELVVADYGNRRVVVVRDDADCEVLAALGSAPFSGVAMHGGDVYVQDLRHSRCVVVSS
jgi:tripartite motif-containing protein 2/3/tripartite motif-containing protein 71